MQLPLNFEFSQTSLQDYIDCRRRFFLRYIQQIAWPAVQTEPVIENERHIRRGERFHRLAQQYLLGIPPQLLDEFVLEDKDDHLPQWWQSFIKRAAPDLNGIRFVELTLNAPLVGYRLSARYDLVLVTSDDHVLIYDWKTSLHRPKRPWLASRMQTRVYPYLLTSVGTHLWQNHASQSPEKISMIYWFTAFPDQPERFIYDKGQFVADGHLLENQVKEILSLPESAFELTPHIAQCAYCVYRSLCDRGISAGSMDDREVDTEPDPNEMNLDFDQIAEISF